MIIYISGAISNDFNYKENPKGINIMKQQFSCRSSIRTESILRNRPLKSLTP